MSEQIKMNEYKFEKIDALSQFHIVRRLAPVIGELTAAIVNSGIAKSGVSLKEVSIEQIDFEKLAKDLSPVLAVIAKLPDEDMNYALFGLLKGVYRKSGGAWARVTTDNQVFMFEDIKADMALMLQLAGKSFASNLSGFINALPSGLKEGAVQSQQIG